MCQWSMHSIVASKTSTTPPATVNQDDGAVLSVSAVCVASTNIVLLRLRTEALSFEKAESKNAWILLDDIELSCGMTLIAYGM